MAKNAEYVISIVEILKLIKRRWKFVGIIALIFIILCGGYKAFSGSEGEAVQPNAYYDIDKAYYDYYADTLQDINTSLKADWQRICEERLNSPIYSVDPYQCDYEQIVIRFKDEIGSHDKTVQNWILKADNSKLFGEKEKDYSDYKSDLILVGDAKLSSETDVQLISVEGFDTKEAADYLIKHFAACAKEDNLDIAGISRATAKGYNRNLDNYLQDTRNRYNVVYTSFMNSKALYSYITEPQQPQIQQSKSKDVIKFALVGLILGLIVSIAWIFFDVIRKREIISVSQIENAFDLELLSDCSSGSDSALDVLNANLDVMTGEHNKIAIIADKSIKEIDDIVSKWTQESDRSFELCKDIFDNPATIEALNSTEGIVVGVRLGKSKLEQIQRIVLRAEKLGQRVLGFVLL